MEWIYRRGAYKSPYKQPSNGCLPRIPEVFSPRGWVPQLIFGQCWNPKEVGSNASEGMPQQQERWTCQAKSKSFLLLCPFSWSATRGCGPDWGCAFWYQMIRIEGVSSNFRSRKAFKGMPSCLGFSRLHMQLSWHPRLAIAYRFLGLANLTVSCFYLKILYNKVIIIRSLFIFSWFYF